MKTNSRQGNLGNAGLQTWACWGKVWLITAWGAPFLGPLGLDIVCTAHNTNLGIIGANISS